MLPVFSINGLKIGSGERGEVFVLLLYKWSKKVGVDIEGQIKNWDKSSLRDDSLTTPYQFGSDKKKK
jgi:hypothetical protein